MIYEHMRREIERAIHDAEHPVGMGPHTGMARISAATLRRLMAENAALEAAARQALERLRKYHHGHGFAEDAECIAALRAALKEQE